MGKDCAMALNLPVRTDNPLSELMTLVKADAFGIADDFEPPLQDGKIRLLSGGRSIIDRLDANEPHGPHRPAQEIPQKGQVVFEAVMFGRHVDLQSLP